MFIKHMHKRWLRVLHNLLSRKNTALRSARNFHVFYGHAGFCALCAWFFARSLPLCRGVLFARVYAWSSWVYGEAIDGRFLYFFQIKNTDRGLCR